MPLREVASNAKRDIVMDIVNDAKVPWCQSAWSLKNLLIYKTIHRNCTFVYNVCHFILKFIFVQHSRVLNTIVDGWNNLCWPLANTMILKAACISQSSLAIWRLRGAVIVSRHIACNSFLQLASYWFVHVKFVDNHTIVEMCAQWCVLYIKITLHLLLIPAIMPVARARRGHNSY